ncbi:MAG: hypothetical protein ACI9V8_000238 [Urechidicola sp.]|jgi:hypothetical protein
MKYFSWALLSMILLLANHSATAAEQGHTHKHGHNQIEVSTMADKPSVKLHAMQDAMSGWNIQIETINFQFAPENVNSHPTAGEGHAHLYVDGKKITRIYGPWFFLSELPAGTHSLQVTLNANDHSGLVLHGEPVADSLDITQ